MLFSWLKNRRRRKLLAEPFPAAWEEVLRRNVGHLAWLSAEQRGRLRQATQVLVAEREFEGCRGLDITEEVRVTVAAEAAILLLGLDDFYFDNVPTVLVYPDEFVVPDRQPIADDLVMEGQSERLGEAHRHGPVILAWKEALHNARHPGYGSNLIFHEFAHQLDMRNGDMDGTPDLADAALRERWARVMDREYARLCRAADHDRQTLLDPYGATSPAEFFAVTTECFFDLPWELERRHAELYAVMRSYFRQDPACWTIPAGGGCQPPV